MIRTQAGVEPALGGAPGASGSASGRTRFLSTDSSADFAALAADAALVAHDLMAAEGCLTPNPNPMQPEALRTAAEDVPAAGGRASAAHDLMAAQGCSRMAAEARPAAGGCASAAAEQGAAAGAPESGTAPEPAAELAGAGGCRQQAPAGECCSPCRLYELQTQSR